MFFYFTEGGAICFLDNSISLFDNGGDPICVFSYSQNVRFCAYFPFPQNRSGLILRVFSSHISEGEICLFFWASQKRGTNIVFFLHSRVSSSAAEGLFACLFRMQAVNSRGKASSKYDLNHNDQVDSAPLLPPLELASILLQTHPKSRGEIIIN